MRTICNRVLVIVGLALLSGWLMLPKDVTQRVRDVATGRMKDTTVRRVPINLGLDLQGGIHLALEVDQSKGPVRDCADAIQRAGQAAGANVAQLFGADTTKGKKAKPAKGKAAKDTTELNAPGPLSSLLFQGALPGEYLVPEEQVPAAESLLARPEVQRLIPRGINLKWGTEVASRGARAYRALYAVEDRPIITGEELEQATARRDQVTNQSVVDFVLSRSGGRKFERETGRHVGHYMAIILDDRVQRHPPTIKSQIGQRGLIELGSKPLQEAQDLALVLRAGALPAPLAS